MKVTFPSVHNAFQVKAPQGTMVSLRETPVAVGDGVYVIGEEGSVNIDEQTLVHDIYLSIDNPDYTVERGQRVTHPVRGVEIRAGNTCIPFRVGGGGGTGPTGDIVITEDIRASITVGGIVSGKYYPAGTLIETILADLLNPVGYPTLTNPSATVVWGSAQHKLQSVSHYQVGANATITLNRGSISPAYGTSGYRSGPATAYEITGGDGVTVTGQVSDNVYSVQVEGPTSGGVPIEGMRTITASVSYSAGEQPKDSTGANYSTPLPAGTVNASYEVEFVYSMWGNLTDIMTISKLDLISKSEGVRVMDFVSQTVANPEVFDMPASWTVTAVEAKNELTGAWDDASDQFAVTDVTHTAPDDPTLTIYYKRYTCSLGYATGPRTIRVKWN